jgi:hypothetical protein
VIAAGASNSCISLLIESSLVSMVSSPALDRCACFPCDPRRLKHAKAIKAAAIPTMRPPTEPPMAAPNVVGSTDAIAALPAAEAMLAEAPDGSSGTVDVMLAGVLVGDVLATDALLDAEPAESVSLKDCEDESVI